MPLLYQACFGPSHSGRVHLIAASTQATKLVLCERCTPTNQLKGKISAERFCKQCLKLATDQMEACGLGSTITAENLGIEEIL